MLTPLGSMTGVVLGAVAGLFSGLVLAGVVLLQAGDPLGTVWVFHGIAWGSAIGLVAGGALGFGAGGEIGSPPP
jgi:hypothetical protein